MSGERFPVSLSLDEALSLAHVSYVLDQPAATRSPGASLRERLCDAAELVLGGDFADPAAEGERLREILMDPLMNKLMWFDRESSLSAIVCRSVLRSAGFRAEILFDVADDPAAESDDWYAGRYIVITDHLSPVERDIAVGSPSRDGRS